MSVAALFALAAAASAPAAAPPAGTPAKPPAAPRVIQMHEGIPGHVYIGQSLADLLRQYPDAKVTPFAGQTDAVVVQIPEAGISCQAVGDDAEHLTVASAGFVLAGAYEGFKESGLRTSAGVGKGSTVNDLIEAHGPPAEIARPRQSARPPGREAPAPPRGPEKYIYARADGAVKTHFVVQDDMVVRVVVVELEPVARHILRKHPPEE